MSELERVAPVTVEVEALKYLGLDPDNIATRALVLLAERYRLDPLLGEIQLIDTNRGRKLYVSRDGMLAVAHASGKLDGIVVTEQRRNTEGNGWTAYVEVWRKDMTHPFRYGAQCKDTEDQAKRGNGPEMALARAERRALKRAFRIRSDFYPERPDIEDDDNEIIEATISPSDTAISGGAEAPKESTTRPSAPPSPDTYPVLPNDNEWLAPTPEQSANVRDLFEQLGINKRSDRHLRLALMEKAVGHVVADTRLLDRGETQRVIDFLTNELVEHAQALADANREGVPDYASELDERDAIAEFIEHGDPI